MHIYDVMMHAALQTMRGVRLTPQNENTILGMEVSVANRDLLAAINALNASLSTELREQLKFLE